MEIAPAELIWGVFTRALGLVYLVAFASLYPQVVSIAGARGISPVGMLFDRMRRDFPLHERVLSFPTLLWLSSADWMLRGLVLAGAVAALLVVAGLWSPWALLACYAAYLSIDPAVELGYPWDCALFEAGVLALLLPPLEPLPSLAATAAPSPMVALAYDVLLARVIWGFGKQKFVGTTRRDLGYLREFFVNQPIPTPIGWYAHRLPLALHRAAMLLLYAVELVLPFLIFVGGPLRLLPAAGIAGLMAGIQLTGNYGFFNLITLVLCLPLLDLRASLVGLSLASPADAAVVVILLLGLLGFPFNSWVTRSWPYWPSSPSVASRLLRALGALNRRLMAFRVAHAYGVFPPQATPPFRLIPVIEGSLDGREWREYEYRFIPCHERSRPRFVAPRMPRWDHYVFYDGYGITPSSLIVTAVGGGFNPYHFSPMPPLRRLAQRLAEPESPVRTLLRHDPFAGGPPPRYMRANLYALEPTTPAERRESGRWWRRQLVAEHLPTFEPGPETYRRWLNGPELWHWDSVLWRRRAPAFRAFEARARAAGSVGELEAAVVALTGLPCETIEAFWRELLPAAPPPADGDWRGLRGLVDCLRERFGEERLFDFDRVASALALGLAARHERRIVGGAADLFGLPSYLHVGLSMHQLLLAGRESFAKALDDEVLVEGAAAGLDLSRGLWLWAVLRFEHVAFMGRGFATMRGTTVPTWVAGVPGAPLILPFLADQLGDEARSCDLLHSRVVADARWEVVVRPIAASREAGPATVSVDRADPAIATRES
jgi:hypothetical protein